jgi:hypothetical protein
VVRSPLIPFFLSTPPSSSFLNIDEKSFFLSFFDFLTRFLLTLEALCFSFWLHFFFFPLLFQLLFLFFVYMRVLVVDVILNRSRPPSFSLYKVPCQILTRCGGKEKLDGRNWPSLPYFILFYFFYFRSLLKLLSRKCLKKVEKKGANFSYP